MGQDFVVRTGLEPVSLAARASKTLVSANSTTRARMISAGRLLILDWQTQGLIQSDILPPQSAVSRPYFTTAVGKNSGSRRALVTASKSAASASSLASLQGLPTKDRPTGRPKKNAAGTVTLG